MSDDIQAAVKRTLDRESRVGLHFFLVDALLRRRGDAPLERPAVSLKTLYSDFVVREISPLYNDGKPLSLEPLPLVESDRKRERGLCVENKESGLSDTVLQSVRNRFAPLLNADDTDALCTALRDGASRVEIGRGLSKAQRTDVHRSVSELLSATHVSSTEGGAIVVVRATLAERRSAQRRSAPREFLHFTLYKENIDSNSALRTLARYLGVPTRQLLFSGTKDKRAVTLQRVAVRALDPARLAAVNGKPFGPDSRVRVSGFRQMPEGLRLGDATGNHFRIALRLLPGSAELSTTALVKVQEALRSAGVVNYYGPQRFGTTAVLTSDVGLCMLAGEFETALQLIFQSKAIISPDVKAAAAALSQRNYEEAFRLMPHYCFQERDILSHLMHSPNDFIGCFHKIPRTLGMLYCHAVQSLIWNEMASRRLALEGGLLPMVGDLVLQSVHSAVHARAQQDKADVGGELSDDEAMMLTMSQLKDSDGPLPKVTWITAEDVATGAFRLSDVLLPVPGPDELLQYPRVAMCTKESYMEELRARGADGLMRADNPLVKIYHYHGSYRPLCVRLRRLSMEIVDTAGPREPIIPTDLEAMKDPDAMAPPPEVDPALTTSTRHKAIIVEFSLPPGSYATCVLREFSVCCSEGYHGDDDPANENDNDTKDNKDESLPNNDDGGYNSLNT